MKRFEVEVERTDRYIIELDETVLNEDWMKHFNKYFYDFETLEEHAEHIAQFRSRFGERLIEGYGNVMRDGLNPFDVKDEDVNKAINIRIISEDEEVHTYVNSKQ